jgi:hypothetical protein
MADDDVNIKISSDTLIDLIWFHNTGETCDDVIRRLLSSAGAYDFKGVER